MAEQHDPVAFAEKLRYWRTSRHNPFASQPEEFFKGPTVNEQVSEIIESAKHTGHYDDLEYTGRATLV